MAGFTLLHAAELHLDMPFSGIECTPPAVAAALRDTSLQAWGALVDLGDFARRHQVLSLTCHAWMRDLLVAIGGAARVVEL